jgi:branched-chain amino acid transport system permease protein
MRLPRGLADATELLGPALLVVAAGVLAGLVSRSTEVYVLNAIVSVAIVVAIYVFVGNAGVLSFGQIAFVAVGAFAAGVLTVPLELKAAVLPDLFPVLRDHTIGSLASLGLAALVGAVLALLVGTPLMRLTGLAAGIATFAVLEITHNLLREWTKIGPGATTLSLVPETTGPLQATLGALVVIAVAFAYQRSRFGRLLRATREDAAAARGVGVDVHRQRLWAFTLSGALCGFAGGLLVHVLGSITTEQVYLELTFLTLAMLVVGGISSLWGAVVGALVVSGLDSFLLDAENGNVGFTLPGGTRLIAVGTFMALVLVLMPTGLTRGREFALPFGRLRPRRRVSRPAAAAEPLSADRGDGLLP